MTYRGGCFCGAVRYVCAGPVIDAGYCHCSICRKISGAPVMTWMSVPRDSLQFTTGKPAAFASSPVGIRQFCVICGTHLAFHRPSGAEVDITLMSLDDPTAILPEYHVWVADALPWFHLSDRLPRYADDGPDR